LLTTGGRVLGVQAKGNSIQETLEKAYVAVNKIKFEGKHYRKDIGNKHVSLFCFQNNSLQFTGQGHMFNPRD
jgi:phosphoribosylamine---glycine ligase